MKENNISRNNINETLKIGAVGDICPGDKAIMGLGVLSKTKKYGVEFPFDGLRNSLSGFDLLMGNFEGILSEKVIGSRPIQLTFCGQPDFGRALASVGFHVLNLANNHTLEHGSGIFQETIGYLENAGIRICGLRSKSSEFYSEPVILSRKGKTIGILGYNWIGTERHPNADEFIAQVHDGIVNYSWHRDAAADRQLRELVSQRNVNVIQDIKRLKEKVDIVILAPHWGYEFVHYPPGGVILEARTFVDAGADMIIGSHPHVIQGKERYKDALIFYSLGNFIFDLRGKDLRYSVLLDISWSSKRDVSHCIHPLFINSQFQPELAKVREKKHILNIMDMSNRKIESVYSEKIPPELEDNSVYYRYEAFYRKSKIKTIINHFIAIKEDYRVLLIILKKMQNLFDLIIARLKGEKKRW